MKKSLIDFKDIRDIDKRIETFIGKSWDERFLSYVLTNHPEQYRRSYSRFTQVL